MNRIKMIITDLDGTLLRNDKTLSEYTVNIFRQCRSYGILTAVATARGESNAKQYIASLDPDIIISSGGALIKSRCDIIYRCGFSAEETSKIINTALRLTNNICEITVDTLDKHYWNYKQDPHILSPDWGCAVYTDYSSFNEECLKICVETDDEHTARKIADSVGNCDFARFSDVDWYKFSNKNATKGNAVNVVSNNLGIALSDIAAFGDDFVDMEMLGLCGIGVAVENSIDEVKQIADFIADSNENDGVAKFIEANILASYKQL